MSRISAAVAGIRSRESSGVPHSGEWEKFYALWKANRSVYHEGKEPADDMLADLFYGARNPFTLELEPDANCLELKPTTEAFFAHLSALYAGADAILTGEK
jgi:hypothetical protein